MKTTPEFEHLVLQRFRPNRRRGWKWKLRCFFFELLMGLLVMAELFWLFSCVSGERPRSARNEETRMANEEFVLPHSGFDIPAKRAGFGASDTLAVVIVLSVIVVLLVRLVRGARAEAEGCDVEHLRGCIAGCATAEALSLWDSAPLVGAVADDPLALGGNEIPPSEGMPVGMSRLDAALIVHACASRVGLIRSIVQGAQRPSTEDEQEEALATAERLLGDLRVTLFELRAKFQAEIAPQRLEGRGDEVLNAGGAQ
jgi:hypothetical protein